MLCVLAFVLGFFLGGITVSLLREEVKKAEKLVGDVASPAPTSEVPSLQSVAAAVIAPSIPAAVVSHGKKMCRAVGPETSGKQPSAAFRCPKCCKTVGRRGPLLSKRALKSHMLKCSG